MKSRDPGDLIRTRVIESLSSVSLLPKKKVSVPFDQHFGSIEVVFEIPKDKSREEDSYTRNGDVQSALGCRDYSFLILA
jgi:hypothetical protein